MRKKRSDKKFIKPDPRFKEIIVSKFINYLMWDGKKSTSRSMVYDCFEIIEKRTKKPPMEIFKKAISNVQPLVEVRSRRVGGATYQVPMEVPVRRQDVLAFRWLKDAFRKKKGRTSADKLASEVVDAFNKVGSAMTTRENIHKMAEANKAFAYYA